MNREGVVVVRCALHGGAADAPARAARRDARQGRAHDDQRHQGSVPAGSGRQGLQGRQAPSALGVRIHVRVDLAGLAVRGLCRRCVRPAHRGLACEQFHAHRLRPRCPGASPVRKATRARRRPDPPLGPRVAYVSIRYTQRLAEAGIEPSVGSKGDSYDNALAETINGLYKAELIHRRAPWKTKESVELATLQWVSWFNNHRLMEPLGYIPPAEAEANYYRQLASQTAKRESVHVIGSSPLRSAPHLRSTIDLSRSPSD